MENYTSYTEEQPERVSKTASRLLSFEALILQVLSIIALMAIGHKNFTESIVVYGSMGVCSIVNVGIYLYTQNTLPARKDFYLIITTSSTLIITLGVLFYEAAVHPNF